MFTIGIFSLSRVPMQDSPVAAAAAYPVPLVHSIPNQIHTFLHNHHFVCVPHNVLFESLCFVHAWPNQLN